MSKKYSIYHNPNSSKLNAKPVKIGSVIVASLSDYEKLPKNVLDHKRESIIVIMDKFGKLGVVYIHGKYSIDGKSRKKKEEAGLWEEIEKNGQKVYVDIDIRVTDAKGNPIRQGKIFKNTDVLLEPDQLEKVEKHIYSKGGRKSHNIRNIIAENKKKRDKK